MSALRRPGIRLAAKRRVRPTSVVSTLLAAAGVAGTLLAQDTPQGSFGAAVEVRVVNVDVQVVDRDGVPVDGLEKGDFELRVDGRPVEISNFSSSLRSLAAQQTQQAAGESAGATEREPTAPPPPSRLVVLLDDLHLVPSHRNRVLRELESLLEDQEKLGVEVGIVRYDRALRILRTPGERGRSIAQVLAEEQQRSASGAHGETARRAVFREIEDLYTEFQCTVVGDMRNTVRRYADELRSDVLDSLAALQELTTSLAGLPGRRALLYVGDGLPLEPGQEASLLVTQLCGRGDGGLRDTGDLSHELSRVVSAANAARITYYSYHAGGYPDATSADSSALRLDAGTAMLARENEQSPLQSLATDTGGRALISSNRIAPLIDQLSEDFATAYSLGFTPTDDAADGKTHEIEVRVRRDGVRVRHRSSYLARPASEERGERLMALLRFGGGAVDNPLGVQVQVAPTKPAGKDEIELPLRILVPASKLVFMPGDASVAMLEIQLAASDDRGRSSPVQRRTLKIPRAALSADLSQAVARIPFDLKLRRGPTNLAISVRDMVGDVTSFLGHALDLR